MDIPGNEAADRLTKEAAEAEDMPDDKGKTSQAEVKHGAMEAVTTKWWHRSLRKGQRFFPAETGSETKEASRH